MMLYLKICRYNMNQSLPHLQNETENSVFFSVALRVSCLITGHASLLHTTNIVFI